MKKIATILALLFLAATFGFGQRAVPADQSQPQNPQINTRIDNIGYWTKLAKQGLVPYNPVVPLLPAQGIPTKSGMGITDQMSTDVVVDDEAGVTQSENSVAVDPTNNAHLLNSNNSKSASGFLGADYFNATDDGQTWTGSKFGAGGANDGDPSTAINLNGRQFVGFINSAGGQSVAHSDDGTSWTSVLLANNGTGANDLLDKNHLVVDNDIFSLYNGHIYSAWTQFVSGSTDNNDIVFSRSINNGASFSTPVNISNGVSAGAFNHGVNLQTGPNGQVYATWVIYDVWGPTYFENAIGFARSTNGGASFTAPVRINNNIHGIRPNSNTPTTNATGKNMRVNSFPSMAVDVSGGAYNGYIYIVWANVGVPGVNTGTNVSIYCMRSTDGGTTWGTPVRVNQGTSANDYASYMPWITCDQSTGKLYCVFYDDRNLGSASTAVETWMAYSENGGASWTDIRVGDVSFTPSPIPGLATGYFGDYLGITANNNRVYPTWTDNRSGRALTYVSPIHYSGYCIASGGCDEYISNVSVGSINNSSACDGYQNFTNLSTNIPVNSSAAITVTNGTPYIGDQCGIWVDWNNDGDFADAGETISTGGSLTATIAPPYGTTLGPKTMRVRITYTGSVDPCGATQYGEVEDYTINVTSPLPNYWTGTFNQYWHNDQNWSLGHIPTAIEDAYITNAGYQPVWLSIYDDPCKNLTIQSGGTLQVIEKTLTVNGNVNINAGASLQMTNAAGVIKLAGNWTESAGVTGFSAGPGRVVFNGPGHQYIYGSETFNVLEANMGAALRLNNAAYTVTCNVYDWTTGGIDILAGTFNALDLADNGLYGTYWVNAGGAINLTQDGGQYTDLDGEIHMYGGTMTVTGGYGQSYWPYLSNGLIEMTGGILDFRNNGIYLNPSTFTLTQSISGGTIRTNGYFSGSRTDFTPSGGTVELYGPTDIQVSLGTGSSFANLVINKAAVVSKSMQNYEEVFYDRQGNLSKSPLSNGVSAGSDIIVNGTLTIQTGKYTLNGHQTNANTYCHVYGSLVMNNAADKLYVGTTSWQHLEFHDGSSSTLTAGAIYPASWVWSSGAATIDGGTGNTIYFTGSNNTGIQVDGPGSVFGNVDVNKTSGNFYINSYPSLIELAGTLNLHAGNVLDMQNFTMVVHGAVTDNATSTIYLYNGPGKSMNQEKQSASRQPASPNVPASVGSLTIYPDFNLNGLLDIADGNVLVHGRFSSSSTSAIHINGGSFIADSPNHSDKGWEYINGNITMPAGLFELTHNSINLGVSATTAVSGGTLRTGGAFYASNTGTFLPTGGVVEVTENLPDGAIYCGNGNFFYNFLLNKPSGAASYFETDVVVKNNFTIQSGVLGTFSNINVGGNWSNLVGPSGFLPGTGTVTFDGAAAASILTGETFYNLSLNKTYAAFDALQLMQNVNVTNDLHIIDGSMKLVSPANLNITGNLTIDLNAGLNASDGYGPQIFVGKNWTNANTTYSTNYGFMPGNYSQVIFNGSADQFLTTNCAQEAFNNLRIDKSAGKFRPNNNVLCYGELLINTGTWEDNVTGTLHHKFYGNFTVQPAGGFLNAFPLNTVEFTGSQNSILTYSSALGYFHHLLINKTTGFSVTQVGSTSCQFGGNLTVQGGTYNLNSNTLSVFGDVAVNGILSLPASSTFIMSDTKNLSVNSGGRLDISGTAVNPVMIRANLPTAKFGFNVYSGGTIAADYATFRDMGVNGVVLNAGSVLDLAHAFKGCTFQDGASGGTLLAINNSQIMTIRNAVFPTNTWGGASNVTKVPNTGHVYFVDYSGAFSGEAFDADSWNLVDWVATLTAAPTASPALICPGTSSQLNITRTGGLAPFTYLWSPATGLSNATIINPLATPLATTTYNVTVTDFLGTTATGNVLLSVNPVQPVSVTIAASSNPVPPSTFVTFTATPVNGGSLPSYQWKVNGINAGSGLSTFSYVPSNNDHVACVLTSNTLCPSGNPATSNVILMVVVATNTSVTGSVPSPLTLCFDASNVVTVAGGGNTFLVQSGASATMIAGVSISYLYGTTVAPGGYMHGYITSTNQYCGYLPPAIMSVVAGEDVHSEIVSASSLFSIYPNPTTGIFTLQVKGDVPTGNIQVEIFDMRGNALLSTSYASERSHKLTLSDFSPGLYFVKVIAGSQVESLKLVVAR